MALSPQLKLEDFKAKLRDVARPNRFFVSFFPAQELGLSSSSFLTNDVGYFIRSSSIPERTIGEISIDHLGMKQKIIGDPTYENISMTFLSDVEWKVRSAFEEWMSALSSATEDGESKSPIDLKYLGSKATISQLGGKQGEVLAEYNLYEVFPVNIQAIELSMENRDTAQELIVTFSISHWVKK